jgi:putative phage-type endonuclease
MEQLSEEWFAIRRGKVTASRVADMMATTKTGYGASRAGLMAELIAERLTGKSTERFQTDAMKWGVEKEADARDAYTFYCDASVQPGDFALHPTIPDAGASPDGYVGADGLIEIKCPQTNTHIDTLLSGAVQGRYVTQIQFQLACTGRQWCDFVSFDPRMPARMQLFVKRIQRSVNEIAYLEKETKAFLNEMYEKLNSLEKLYGIAKVA